ncbi:GntR family transcriptional regulator [Virgibacillus kimchii]
MNKQEVAYNFIRTRIMDGLYSPGQRLVIDQIARELSSSPIPVREAIRRLEADGLVVLKPYTGAVVSVIDEEEYVETMYVMAVMEGYATALSATYFPESELETLNHLNNKMKEAMEDFDFYQVGEWNRHFHDYLISYCNNKTLLKQVRQIWKNLNTIRRMGVSFYPSRVKESFDDHEEIIRLIKEERNDFHKIEQFVRVHHMNSVEAYKTNKERSRSTVNEQKN